VGSCEALFGNNANEEKVSETTEVDKDDDKKCNRSVQNGKKRLLLTT